MKAQAHVVVLTILDLDGLDANEIKIVIENVHYPNHCMSPDVIKVQTVDLGEWDDDHPLNQSDTADAEWRRLFPLLEAV